MLKQKKGQFYLIAIILIIVIIFGLVNASNKVVTQQKPTKFYDLSKDYEAETSKVVDYGIYNKYSPSVNITEKIKNITETFRKSSFNKNYNYGLIFLYGNTTDLQQVPIGIETIQSPISYELATDSPTAIQTTSQTELTTKEYTRTGNIIEVKFLDNTYSFTLTEEDNFYFVVQSLSSSGEKVVITRD